MKKFVVPPIDALSDRFGFDRPAFFATFPALAPTVAELDAALLCLPPHPAINRFLVSFCRLFDKTVASDKNTMVAYGDIGTIISRMCSAGHLVTIGKRTYTLRSLYCAAIAETGHMKRVFRQKVATMYARHYALN